MSTPLDLLSLIVRGTVSQNQDGVIAPTSLYFTEDRNVKLPEEISAKLVSCIEEIL
jgi:hypothetical protein